MKKATSLIIALLLAIVVFCSIKSVFGTLIQRLYYDKVGDDNSFEKSQSLVLQEEAARTNDNLFIYGSSELEYSKSYSTHVSNVFSRRAERFQVQLVGRAGYEQVAHSLLLGALGHHLKGQKLVFILSPQWFFRQNIDEKSFAAIVKPQHYYQFFLNPDLSLDLKKNMAQLLTGLARTNKYANYDDLRFICSLYIKDDPFTRAKRIFSYPYYWAQNKVLELGDDIFAFHYLKKNREFPKHEEGGQAELNWESMKQVAIEKARAAATNNPFFIENSHWIVQIHKTPEPLGMYKKMSLHYENLYDELEVLLQIMNELQLDPLFVHIPFHGLWADYTQLDRGERHYYYNRVNAMLAQHHFKVADFTDKEYEPYFFMDGAHLGWVGWVYVNEAIIRYWRGENAGFQSQNEVTHSE